MLRHLRGRSKAEYGRRVHLLADYFGGADPATLSEAQVTAYFVFLIQEKGLARSSIRQARAAIELFFKAVVKVQWAVFSTIRTRGAVALPVVLSRGTGVSVELGSGDKKEKALPVSRKTSELTPRRTSGIFRA